MKNTLINKVDIDLDLIQLEKLAENLSNRIQLIDQTTKYIFSKLTSCDQNEANAYFDILMDIQSVLSKIQNLYDINLPKTLKFFVNDFDRIDDMETRLYILDKIQNSEYHFGQKLD